MGKRRKIRFVKRSKRKTAKSKSAKRKSKNKTTRKPRKFSLRRITRTLKKAKKSSDKEIVLNSFGPITFAADVKTTLKKACSVMVLYKEDLSPAVKIPINFKIIKGPALLGKEQKESIQISTDSQGLASTDIIFTKKGTVIVSAELRNDSNTKVFFEGRSEGKTHQLFIYTEPTFSVVPGIVKARITALDHHGDIVKRPKLIFEGTSGSDEYARGEIKRLSDSEYEGTFHTKIAGLWEIIVQDVETKALTKTCIHLLPSTPYKLHILSKPYSTDILPYFELRARLEDKFGNSLDPHRINCETKENRFLKRSYFLDEARFLFQHVGYGLIDVLLKDSQSDITKKTVIRFPAAWLTDPGPVYLDSTYSTTLYGNPEINRPISRANVSIEFDTALVKFKNARPISLSNMEIFVRHRLEDNKLNLEIESKKPVSPKHYPHGIPIVEIQWQCIGEGNTCFKVVADR